MQVEKHRICRRPAGPHSDVRTTFSFACGNANRSFGIGPTSAAAPHYASAVLTDQKPPGSILETSTSAADVFATTELLELILLRLPIGQVLLSQRVSKQWRAVTTGSQKLQQALFFQPTAPTQEMGDHLVQIDQDGEEYEYRYTLTRKPRYANYPWLLKTAHMITSHARHCATTITNPLITKIFPRQADDIRTSFLSVAVFRFSPDETANRAHEAGARTWESMFVCQPPCTRLLLAFRAPRRLKYSFFEEVTPTEILATGDYLSASVVEDEEGVTLGDLMEALVEEGFQKEREFSWVI